MFAGINTVNHALFRELLQIVVENAGPEEQREVANDPEPLSNIRAGANE